MADKEVLSFEEINRIDVSKHIEKKMGLSYLSWAWAHAEMKKIDPNAAIIIHEFPDFIQIGEQVVTIDKPFLKDEGGVWVKVTVVLNGKSETEWLPVMDMRNKALPEPDAMAINKAHKRCFVKALALHGLGLYVYAGEDLPEEEPITQANDEQKEQVRGLIERLASLTNRSFENTETLAFNHLKVNGNTNSLNTVDYGKLIAYLQPTVAKFELKAKEDEKAKENKEKIEEVEQEGLPLEYPQAK